MSGSPNSNVIWTANDLPDLICLAIPVCPMLQSRGVHLVFEDIQS